VSLFAISGLSLHLNSHLGLWLLVELTTKVVPRHMMKVFNVILFVVSSLFECEYLSEMLFVACKACMRSDISILGWTKNNSHCLCSTRWRTLQRVATSGW
jgi:hypothetical protein